MNNANWNTKKHILEREKVRAFSVNKKIGKLVFDQDIINVRNIICKLITIISISVRKNYECKLFIFSRIPKVL